MPIIRRWSSIYCLDGLNIVFFSCSFSFRLAGNYQFFSKPLFLITWPKIPVAAYGSFPSCFLAAGSKTFVRLSKRKLESVNWDRWCTRLEVYRSLVRYLGDCMTNCSVWSGRVSGNLLSGTAEPDYMCSIPHISRRSNLGIQKHFAGPRVVTQSVCC